MRYINVRYEYNFVILIHGRFPDVFNLLCHLQPSKYEHHSDVASGISPAFSKASFLEDARTKRKRRASPSMDMAAAVSHVALEVPARTTISMSRMLSLNAIVCGLEFCASAAFCYIPPLLLKAGISEQYMSMVLGIGPLLGFFIVPMIGRASDRCESRFGRRRPFIFVLSILLLVSLFIIPFGDYVCFVLFGHSELGVKMTVWLLVFGSFLLDFTCQTCLTPCEALLSDSSKGTDQSERCFTIYSVMVSIGGCVGYLITALDWSDSSIGLYFGTQERSVFVMLIILYSFSMLMTFGAANEIPLSELQKKRTASGSALSPTKTTDHGYVSDDIISEDGATGLQSKLNGDCIEITYKIPMTKLSFTKFEGVRHFLALNLYAMLPDVIKSLFHVPYVLKRLAVANFCSWTAVMCFNLFYTNFVGQTIYGGDPNAPEDSDLRALYDKGVRMGSWGLLLHCINSAIYAAFIEKISARFDLRRAYFIGMITFMLSMLLMLISRDIYFVNFCATLTGFGYATLTTVPFMLVTNYHEKKEVSSKGVYSVLG